MKRSWYWKQLLFFFRISKLFNHNELDAVRDKKDKFKRWHVHFISSINTHSWLPFLILNVKQFYQWHIQLDIAWGGGEGATFNIHMYSPYYVYLNQLLSAHYNMHIWIPPPEIIKTRHSLKFIVFELNKNTQTSFW